MKNILIVVIAALVAMTTGVLVSGQTKASPNKAHKNYKVKKSVQTVKVKKDGRKAERRDDKAERRDDKAERRDDKAERRDDKKESGAMAMPGQVFSKTNIRVVKQRNVTVIQTLPVGYSTGIYGGNTFYHYRGRYYNNSGNTYTMIAAPIGYRVRVLPIGYRSIFMGTVPHYYYAGVYYRQVGEEYEAVEPRIGTIVPELPDDNVEEVVIDNQTLYEYDNVLYKRVITVSGTHYEVIGKLGK